MNKSLRIVLAMAALLAGLGTARAQDNLDYYWFQNTGNWNDVSNWRVLRAATETAPAEYAIPTELPDATNAVFINGVTPADGTALPSPVSISQNAPAIVTIEVGTVSNAPLADSPFAAGSISLGGTIPANTTVNFTINQPLTVGTAATPGALTANYRVAIRANSRLTVNGPLTFGAAGASLLVGEPVTVTGPVAVNANATITANNELRIGGSLTFATEVTTGRLDINRPVFLGGSLTLAAPANITGTTGSVTFTSTATDARIKSSGAVFNVPVTFGVTTQTTNGRWTLEDNMTLARPVRFVRGYVVALPANNVRPPNDPNLSDTRFNPTGKFIIQLSDINRSTTPAISGGSTDSHVVGFIQLEGASTTTVPKEANGNDQVITLPTGDGTIYRPIGLLGPSAPIFLARYYNYAVTPKPFSSALPLPPPSPITNALNLNSVSDKEYWWVGRGSGSASAKIVLNLHHPDSAVRAYYNLAKWRNLTVAGMHRSTNVWSSFGSRISTTTWNIEATNAINSNHAWYTIGRIGDFPLPVRLLSFSAQQLDGQVKLKWQSAEEKNTSHFEVERSADGKHFSQVLTKKAQGNSNALVSYNAIDNNPLGGTSYYRLKMVDLDGTFEHSKMVSVSTEGGVLVRAYPNPSNGREVRFLAPNGDKLLLQSVRDAFGKAVGYETTDVYAEGLYVSFYGSLPAGFYVATLVTDDDKRERVRVKFVVQ